VEESIHRNAQWASSSRITGRDSSSSQHQYVRLSRACLPRLHRCPADNLQDQVAAAIEAFFWPKIFWDFLTKNLDGAVKPFPVLQIINLLFGIFITLWEWPLGLIAETMIHRSIEARLVVYPLAALSAALIYQGTNPAIYYAIGMGVYFWAYSEGEVSLAFPEPSTCFGRCTDGRIGCGQDAMEPTAKTESRKGIRRDTRAEDGGLEHYTDVYRQWAWSRKSIALQHERSMSEAFTVRC